MEKKEGQKSRGTIPLNRNNRIFLKLLKPRVHQKFDIQLSRGTLVIITKKINITLVSLPMPSAAVSPHSEHKK